jgi:hypothetical protein
MQMLAASGVSGKGGKIGYGGVDSGGTKDPSAPAYEDYDDEEEEDDNVNVNVNDNVNVNARHSTLNAQRSTLTHHPTPITLWQSYTH